MENVRSERVVGNSDCVWAPSGIFHRIFLLVCKELGGVDVFVTRMKCKLDSV
ncbi:hypothetical protein AB205_0033770 [Aquarana catesbeiana]|uniref:Uncharacterized protein n=1 Tax=Aquarana catesbeiana TaxID=8400 RepID=A0A2G9Q3L3_AQUCT|nr:hypothetical protein AB205_0033770 [Aquarana catesbeiana]